MLYIFGLQYYPFEHLTEIKRNGIIFEENGETKHEIAFS